MVIITFAIDNYTLLPPLIILLFSTYSQSPKNWLDAHRVRRSVLISNKYCYLLTQKYMSNYTFEIKYIVA